MHTQPGFAALVRPVIDRVYSSARRAGADQVRAVYTEFGLRPGIEIDFYCGLLTRPMPADSYRALTAYRSHEPTHDVAQGTVTIDDDGAWQLTPLGRDLALAVQRAVGEGAEQLWARRTIDTMPGLAALPRLASLVGILLAAGVATGGPAFRAMSPPYEPADASPAVLLTTRLGALRHHRADAHRAAWQAAGLTVEQIVAMPDNPTRRAIEEATNDRDAPIYDALSPQERVELVALLGALPG
jgi:hypothetical protein